MLRRCNTEILSRKIWLQLFQQHKCKRDFIFWRQLLERSLFYLFKIKVHFLFTLQNIGLFINHVFQKVSHNECSSLILMPWLREFILKLIVFLLKSFILSLLLLEIVFVLLEFGFKYVDHFLADTNFIGHSELALVVVADSLVSRKSVVTRCFSTISTLRRKHTIIGGCTWFTFNFVMKFLVLLLQPLDYLLTEVGSLSQFLFNLFVDADISIESVNLCLHLVSLC